jgi:aminoglycoside phosphotransferase (APT) family kinase protein
MENFSAFIDQPVKAREGEMPDPNKLAAYLTANLPGFTGPLEITQFPGGYSNLTFLLNWHGGTCILRKPPHGANIKSAHDMGREYKVLSALKPVFRAVPVPLLFCDDLTVMGTPFYLMEKVSGIILRNKVPKGVTISPSLMQAVSTSAIDNLAALHEIDLDNTGLESLGKPEGYVQRQVEGWINRYKNAVTNDIPSMTETADWMLANLPAENQPSFIHNDYKYDNLVLDPQDLSHILAVLDWEMATVGDPLMDLGTSLAYWGEEADSPALKPFNLTWLPGNLTRDEVVKRYAAARNIHEPDMLFYFVFGSYKIGGIVQQIYARYKKGFTKDERFAGLIHVLKALADNAQKAVRYSRISHFY